MRCKSAWSQGSRRWAYVSSFRAWESTWKPAWRVTVWRPTVSWSRVYLVHAFMMSYCQRYKWLLSHSGRWSLSFGEVQGSIWQCGFPQGDRDCLCARRTEAGDKNWRGTEGRHQQPLSMPIPIWYLPWTRPCRSRCQAHLRLHTCCKPQKVTRTGIWYLTTWIMYLRQIQWVVH